MQSLAVRMKRAQPIFYGWFIVGVGVLAYALGYGGRYSFSVILPSLLSEFQWPRDQAAAVFSAHFLAYGFMAPFAGHWVDRVGPRKTMVFGTICFSLGLIASGYANTLWHFYLSFGLLSGVGLCLIGAVPFTNILKNWFERKRGQAFSLLFFGVGGAFAWYPAVAFLIDHVGWRKAFVLEGLIVSGTLIPVIILII
jgi:MFS transporter, OFA family, oxalate/formate antiporter